MLLYANHLFAVLLWATVCCADILPSVLAGAQERALRRAITNAPWLDEPQVPFTLVTDITLTAPLPIVKEFSNLTIIGKCRDRNGMPRSCIIDGAGKHTMFSGQEMCYIRLERLIIQNVFGNVYVGGCLVSARYVVYSNNKGPKGVILNSQNAGAQTYSTNSFFRCNFVNNTALFGNGGAFNIASDFEWSSFSFTDCTFRNNRALGAQGGAIYSEMNSFTFLNVTFEGNSAVSGGAIVTKHTAAFTAMNATFIANIATNGRGGAVVIESGWDASSFGSGEAGMHRFCRSAFRGNAANPNRHYRSSNNIFVTGYGDARVGFCPGSPPGGVLAPPKFILPGPHCT